MAFIQSGVAVRVKNKTSRDAVRLTTIANACKVEVRPRDGRRAELRARMAACGGPALL
jgi:hypothetical protein